MDYSYPPTSKHIYIIAEMACSHEGDPAIARTIIDSAGTAGADAIQFQIWKLADLDVPQHPDYAARAKLELSQEEWAGLARYSRERYPEMQIIGCIYERESVDFCEKIEVDAYKLHSADLSNPYLVKYVAQNGRRIDLSVGASTLDEIQTAVQWIVQASRPPIWMMYGFQNFPTNPEDIHLDYMMKLQDLFELPVGYQDHSDGDSPAAFWLPAAAAGMGIGILEKHITHDRSKKGTDYQAALNPDEFRQFVQMVRQIEAAKGSPVPRPFSPAEQVYRQYAKKSIVAGRDLARGTNIGEDDLRFMRAAELGLPPDQTQRLLGRKLKRDIARFALIKERDVE